jgi:putative iron-regulated protein
MSRPFRRLTAALLAASLLGAAACSDDDAASDDEAATGAEPELELDTALATEAARTYADLVYASYTDVLNATTALQAAVRSFTEAPSAATLAAAKQAWLDGRALYGPTEVFRFYDGPIDDPEDGPEGRINAWPLDEAYIDYVAEDPSAGIINNTADYPEITTEVLVEANEAGGETNISTGWHAIEFLLWGQDLRADGAGERPLADYTTSPVAERRATYLNLLADLLVADLTGVRDQWGPEDGSYRDGFEEDPEQAVRDILQGMGMLASFELPEERIGAALETQEQEDEHSCFSDNTIVDIVGNATGVRMAYLADYGGITGTSLSDVVAAADPELDAELREQLDAAVALANGLVGPFDQLILGEDDAPGRVALTALVDALEAEGDTIAHVAEGFGLEITVTG